MLSIGQFAKLVQVSARTIRYYESIGLLKSSARSQNNYRTYDPALAQRFEKISDLQSLGFSLDEIKHILDFADVDLTQSLKTKLVEVTKEITNLHERKERLEELLSVSHKIDLKKSITDTERIQFMKAFKEEVIALLKQKQGTVPNSQLRYLERERNSYDTVAKQEFLVAIRKCVGFAKERGLKLGPGRGCAPSSLLLYAFGFTAHEPSEYAMFPERFSSMTKPDVHIDVQFEGGQEFVDYCREISKTLSYGEINAFKMPLIDIIENVHTAIGQKIDYAAIADDSPLVLSPFQRGDVEKIFLFDMSPEALVMKYENLLPGYIGLEKVSAYFKSLHVESFRDVMNLTALWRPHCVEIIERLERYRLAKLSPVRYEFLSPALQKSLELNNGLIIYHEDIIRIVAAYTDWSYERCNTFRRDLQLHPKKVNHSELVAFKEAAPKEVTSLVLEEAKWTFCQPHILAHSQFTKQCAVLKSLHQDIYYREIGKWEDQHGYTWDDIGIKIKGVSLLQNY